LALVFSEFDMRLVSRRTRSGELHSHECSPRFSGQALGVHQGAQQVLRQVVRPQVFDAGARRYGSFYAAIVDALAPEAACARATPTHGFTPLRAAMLRPRAANENARGGPRAQSCNLDFPNYRATHARTEINHP
jgi:hypothetical protein